MTEYRVIVTGLPPSASWQDLKDHMRKAGEPTYTDVVSILFVAFPSWISLMLQTMCSCHVWHPDGGDYGGEGGQLFFPGRNSLQLVCAVQGSLSLVMLV